ncbi:MAG: Bax inhibitor-1/YccA family protein [Bacteroidota bacterium]
MENNNWNFSQSNSQSISGSDSSSMSKTFMANVFSWMFAALTITAVIAYWFSSDLSMMQPLIKADGTGLSILGWVVMFAPLGFALIMGFAFNKLSYPVLLTLFLAYAAINGVSFSFIFLAYTAASIFKTFAIAAGMFGVMAVLGYTTKQDLTSFGKIMMMGLIGIIIASLVNFFLKSSAMEYIISIIGVVVFTGLTAYDVQKLKNIGTGTELDGATGSKLAIMGAFNLYLDFINLFLMLLRLFGDRK